MAAPSGYLVRIPSQSLNWLLIKHLRTEAEELIVQTLRPILSDPNAAVTVQPLPPTSTSTPVAQPLP